jgi:DNA-binding transcriptional MerR regulator
MVRLFKDDGYMASKTEFSTSQLARALGVYEQKIRQLDKRGILAPRRDIFGNRIFGPDDLRKGREYLASKRIG